MTAARFREYRAWVERVAGLVAIVLAVTGPIGNWLFGSFWVNSILTQTLWLGIAATSLIFLSAYGGMVSLCQVSLYGISGLVLANAVTGPGTKGLHLHWSPWVGRFFFARCTEHRVYL